MNRSAAKIVDLNSGPKGGKWIAPSEKDAANSTLERVWDVADQFRANSGLKAREYSGSILGLIFLRFAEVRFAKKRAVLEKVAASSRRGFRIDELSAYYAEGILCLSHEASSTSPICSARTRTSVGKSASRSSSLRYTAPSLGRSHSPGDLQNIKL